MAIKKVKDKIAKSKTLSGKPKLNKAAALMKKKPVQALIVKKKKLSGEVFYQSRARWNHSPKRTATH